VREILVALLKKHEGLKLHPYVDSVGKLTIGYGRNLDDKGISLREADDMLDHDIGEVVSQCIKEFEWFAFMSSPRQAVVASMVFNIGMGKFKAFKQTIAHLANGRYDKASVEMLNSKWAKQVGNRAIELSNIMKNDRIT